MSKSGVSARKIVALGVTAIILTFIIIMEIVAILFTHGHQNIAHIEEAGSVTVNVDRLILAARTG